MPKSALAPTARQKKSRRRSEDKQPQYPDNVRGRRICIAVTAEGVTLYGNRQAFRSLAKWMDWLADSPESEHYECHLMWHFLLPSPKKVSPAVWPKFDRRIATVREKDQEFDVTFMMVENSDLSRLRDPRTKL